MTSIQEILEIIGHRKPGADLESLRKAYEYAASVHDRRVLVSGAPFISFPLAVAAILAQMGQGEATIAAALLSDTVGDATNLIEDIRAAFGEEVAGLVDGVGQIRLGRFDDPEEQGGEHLHNKFLSGSEDVRALIIKLADRLHTMRGLSCQRPHRQEIIVREVMAIYIPLAKDLGLPHLALELEELCSLYIRPYEDHQADDRGDGIYVLTPKGAKVFLPKGATPVDLAYQIHREVGDRGVGARINGRLAPLSTELRDGDTVEIISSAQGRPRPEWLEFVKTDEARTRIRRFVAAEDSPSGD
jgi:Guanosine polyphosphate pyrophosphohydrolases/synthetases